MRGESSFKDKIKGTGRGLLNFIPQLIKPQAQGYISALNAGEDFQWDMDATHQTKRDALKYLLNQGIEGVSDGKFGLTGGIGLEYRPNERSRYYAEKRDGGFEIGGSVQFPNYYK